MIVHFKINPNEFVYMDDETIAGDYYSNWLNSGDGYHRSSAGGYYKSGEVFGYSTSAGNFIEINKTTGEGIACGARHGIPWASLGAISLKDAIIGWHYPVGGTMTPHLNPWEHPSDEEAALLKKKHFHKVVGYGFKYDPAASVGRELLLITKELSDALKVIPAGSASYRYRRAIPKEIISQIPVLLGMIK